MNTLATARYTLSLADGRFSYTLSGKELGWERIGFTLDTQAGT